MFFGVQPFVSGNDWDDPRAPWNQVEPLYETCPHCNGDGGIYYNDDGAEIIAADYDRLSDEDKSMWKFEECEHCDGVGTIIVERDLSDYDDYNG